MITQTNILINNYVRLFGAVNYSAKMNQFIGLDISTVFLYQCDH